MIEVAFSKEIPSCSVEHEVGGYICIRETGLLTGSQMKSDNRSNSAQIRYARCKEGRIYKTLDFGCVRRKYSRIFASSFQHYRDGRTS